MSALAAVVCLSLKMALGRITAIFDCNPPQRERVLPARVLRRSNGDTAAGQFWSVVMTGVGQNFFYLCGETLQASSV